MKFSPITKVTIPSVLVQLIAGICLISLPMISSAQKPIGHYSCSHYGAVLQTNSTQNEGDIDVLNYDINLDFRDFSNRKVEGYTAVTYVVKESITSYELSLEGLTIDSITKNGEQVSFTHTGTQINISEPGLVGHGDTNSIKVFYNGQPIKDASWGGFYYSGDYAFNLGVAFTSNPHNYGRVWFPCRDNFTDRATYKFSIRCPEGKRAFCNGRKIGQIDHADGKTYVWKLDQPIPTYLASVAIAPYVTKEWLHPNLHAKITLASVKADSAKMSESFKHLDGCIDAYVNRYGEHTFDRVGFNLVPFNGGAMEHATNIAYPRFGADGLLTYETLYAHELGHHWWGNTVTCRTAEDMWINEGWASYSERIFLEWIYGKERYDEDISANHRAVLHYAHLRDGDTLAISGIGHNNTYGMHVYDKGADVAHTLRGYMGDSAFFTAIQSFMSVYKFKDVNSDDLKKHFQQFTSADLDAFFKNWVYNPGFPHFEILSMYHEAAAPQAAHIDIQQKVRFAPELFENVPLEITFWNRDMSASETRVVNMSGARKNWVLALSFIPYYAAIDFNKKLSDAVTDEWHMVKDTGFYDFNDAMMTMDVQSISDSALVRVEHHWVAPDAYFNHTDIFLSRERYWTVDGIMDDGFQADATIEYFGRKTGANYPAGYLDVDLIRGTEESMALLYRDNPGAEWEEWTDVTWNMGSKYDKRGSFVIHNVTKGQYAFGVKEEDRLSTELKLTTTNDFVEVKPNPATNVLNVEISHAKNGLIEITDGSGKLVYSDRVVKNKCTKKIDVSMWPRGVYFLGVVLDEKPYKGKPVLLR